MPSDLQDMQAISSWRKDALVIYEFDENGAEHSHWCLECTEGRLGERECRELEEAANQIVIDSDDEMAAQEGGPGNSDYKPYK